MKKTILGTSLALGAVLALTACGSSSSENAKFGKAFYLDSAVSGINYKCGSKEGITGANGEFTFEVGSSCTFYLGDIQLREIDKADLADGAKIIEEDVRLAALLQSLDTDGDPTKDGITISPEVVAALTTALHENGGDGSLPDTAEELAAVVAALSEVEGYNGHAVSENAAQEHLDHTQTVVQTEVTQALFEGKTFYAYFHDDEGEGVAEVKINADATSWTYHTIQGGSDSGTETLEISGKTIIVHNEDTDIYQVTVKDKYIALKSKDNALDFYFNKADAEARLTPTSTTGSSRTLTDLIVGKTLYQHCNNTIETITFGTNGKITFIDGNGVSEETSYRISGNIIYTTEDGTEEIHTLIESNNQFIKFDEQNHGETTTFYFSRADAVSSPAKDCGEDDTTSVEGGASSAQNTNPCHINGNTVSVDEGETCNYQNHTVACQGSRVTLDGSISGQEVNLNGTKFTCTL